MALHLDGETRIYLIVGDPIAQVKSPADLSRIMAERGANALVIPAHVAAGDFDAFMQSVGRMRNLDGIVVTVPHKAAALAWCGMASDRAKGAGAANILCRQADGSWWGDHTDGRGYMDGIAARGFEPKGKRALLIGAGGAGSAIAFEILARGAGQLGVHDIDKGRRDALVDRLSIRFPGRVGAARPDPRGYDLIANASPLGMRAGDPLPVDPDLLMPGQFVADAVTKPAITPLIEAARAKGCATMPGSGMFDAQSDLLVSLLLASARRQA